VGVPRSRDYDAALVGSAVRVQQGIRFLRVVGKAPGAMLDGLLSNRPPSSPGPRRAGWLHGSVVYATLLTSKGRMITDLRVFVAKPGESEGGEEGFLLELPEKGVAGAVAHLAKFLPPRLARMEDRSGALTLLTLTGAEAPEVLASAWSEAWIPGPPAGLEGMMEGEEMILPLSSESFLRVTPNGNLRAPAWDLILPSGLGEDLLGRLGAGGVVPLSGDTLETLRIEKGRPAFGVDMDENTIPLEAGIQRRAIDARKGCYTGQEVIVRIRDRGHVNKELRGFLMGTAPVPSAGAELVQDGREKPVGWVTSATSSPAFSQTIALGYLRRGVDSAVAIRVGGLSGPRAAPRFLNDEGWILD